MQIPLLVVLRPLQKEEEDYDFDFDRLAIGRHSSLKSPSSLPLPCIVPLPDSERCSKLLSSCQRLP